MTLLFGGQGCAEFDRPLHFVGLCWSNLTSIPPPIVAETLSDGSVWGPGDCTERIARGGT